MAMAVLRVHGTKVSLPNEISLQVEAIDSLSTEIRKDKLAVGHRRGRGQASGRVASFQRDRFSNYFFPENVSSMTIDRPADAIEQSLPASSSVRIRACWVSSNLVLKTGVEPVPVRFTA